MLAQLLFRLTIWPLTSLFWFLVYPIPTFRRLFFGPRKAPMQLTKEMEERLNDPALGTFRMVTTESGKYFRILEQGDLESDRLVLFIHGFPECAYSWRHQLPLFPNSHCVAMELRGFTDSFKPPSITDYRIELLIEDVKDMIDTLGHKEAVIISHDWGGIISWAFAHAHPSYVSQLVVMNCPHPRLYEKHVTFSQLRKSWYIFALQPPILPEGMAEDQDCAMVMKSVHGKQGGVRDRSFLDKVDANILRYEYSKPGVATASINYYRNLLFPGTPSSLKKKIDGEKLTMPILVLWGTEDLYLNIELMETDLDLIADDIRLEPIENCSHWVQQDRPDLVNEHLLAFISDN